LECRDLHGGAPVAIYSETAASEEVARLKDFLWLADGRMVLMLNETDTGGLSSLTTKLNLWLLRVDQRSGKRQQELTRITDWPAGSGLDNVNVTHDGRIAFRRIAGHSAVYVARAGSRREAHQGGPRRLQAKTQQSPS
jgi:hypothetical protein